MIKRRCLVGGLLVALGLMWAPPPLLPAAEPIPKTPAAGAENKPQIATVTIFNTGDLHEHSGTLARIAGFVKQQKKKDPNVLLVDAGDFLNKGEPQLAATAGEGMIALMSAAGYDVCILGNHDYVLGKDRILELCRKYPEFPLVLGNCRWSEEDKPKTENIPRYKIFELQGVKVAVIGTGTHYMNHAHGPRFPIFHERLALRDELLGELRKRADVIVVITHLFERSDFSILEACADNPPDVLIGGHSHKRFARWFGKTYVTKAGFHGRHLGVVTIKWDGQKIVSCIGGAMPVRGDWPEDLKVKTLREKYVIPAPKKEEKPGARTERPALIPL